MSYNGNFNTGQDDEPIGNPPDDIPPTITRLRWVPFFKSKEQEEAAIAETSAKIREVYGL